jgi:hypothetical protein
MWVPATDKDDPMRATLRMLMPLPTMRKSKIEQLFPKRAMHLIESELPREALSTTERRYVDPIWANP